MPINTYTVEDPSTREGFEDLLLNAIRGKNLSIPVKARRNSDELSVRRNKEEKLEDFELRIHEVHPDPDDFFVNAQITATHQWVHVTVGEKVSFEVVE